MTASPFAAGPTASLAHRQWNRRAPAPVQAPRPTGDGGLPRAPPPSSSRQVFIAQMLQADVRQGPPRPTGRSAAARGEEIFRGQLLDQYGRMIATNGGLGISDALTRDIMSLQEV